MHLFNSSPVFNLYSLADEQANKQKNDCAAAIADDGELQFIKLSPAPAPAQ